MLFGFVWGVKFVVVFAAILYGVQVSDTTKLNIVIKPVNKKLFSFIDLIPDSNGP